jgi:hypothetical protein
MVLGDTHAAGLCVLACQHARTLERTPVEDDRLKAHEAIAAWELGLGKPDTPGPHFGWAAMFSLCLAALRVGLVAGPPSPTLAELCDRTLWRPRVGWLRRLCRIGSDDREWGGDADGD